MLLVRNRDGIAIERSSDTFDEVQQATERELAIRNLDRDSNVLRKVRGAIGRIAEGDFGVCMHCEEDISPRRLAAVPWAEFCVRCQEIVDLGRAMPPTMLTHRGSKLPNLLCRETSLCFA
jgi:DnaK suppressor protein